MRPSIKHGYCSFGTSKGGHTSGHSMFGHSSTGHHGGSHLTSHHGGAHISNHGMTHHHGGSHTSHHGRSQLSHHGSSHVSCHGSSHLSHHGSSHLSHHGGSHVSHHGSSHPSHHGGSHLSHKGGSCPTHHAGGSHVSHYGGSNLTNHGASNMSHHGSSHQTHYGGGPHLSFHRGSHLSHHKSHLSSPHTSHHGSSTKVNHGSSHMSCHGGSFKMSHGESHISHHGGHHKSMSSHGGSSCKSVSFSKHSSMNNHKGQSHGSHCSSHGSWKNDGLLSINEKETMQMLNERLSSYLDKVSALEQENAQLERKICEWYANNAPSSLPDSSQFFRMMSDLQNQIAATTTENARIVLQIDNARLAADDFREKYEMELNMSNNAEADVNALRRVVEGLNRENCDAEVQSLQEELQEMRRNHEEEVNCLRAQMGARINVELNAAPSIDLNRALGEIRDEYENLMDRNLRDAENMFRTKGNSEELNRQVISGCEQLQSVQTEVIVLKRTVQTLEIELQSQMSMTSALESTLAETQGTYSSQIAQLQAMIDNVECQLAQIRSDLERQNYEYKILMDQKTHLEMEIATYKRLLEGHDIHVSDYHSSSGNHGSHHKVVHHTTEHHHESKC